MKSRRLLNLSALAVAAAFALSPSAALAAGGASTLMTGNAILGKGDGQMLVKADRVTYDTGATVVTAEGHVEIDYNGRIVTADRVVYDDNKDIATADGHVVMMAPDGTVGFSDHAVLTDKMRDGVFNAFTALIGQNGRFGAVRAVRIDQGTRTVATRAVFTPCLPSSARWADASAGLAKLPSDSPGLSDTGWVTRVYATSRRRSSSAFCCQACASEKRPM